MAYATQQDLIDRYGSAELAQLTDRVAATTIDPVTVARALTDASGLMDGYLGKAAALPLSVVPPVATDMCCRIARYRLWPQGLDKDDKIAVDYRDALAWLSDVARGVVSLDAGGVTPAPAGGGQVKVSAADRVFTRSSLGAF